MAAEGQAAAREVLVRLSNKGPKDVLFPDRRITLTRDNSVVPIGRASKVRSKGFVADKTNGWFDSPVMSRDHAELVADLDTRTVFIRDIGSLHGTFLNDDQDRIADNDERPLTDGDTIRFGVPIWRGKDTFAPTIVDVGLVFTASVEVTGNVFKVPDYVSDIEESDSEGDLVEDEHDTTIRTGVFFKHHPSDHIDLTEEGEKRAEVVTGIFQLDGPSADGIIDLTSPLREASPSESQSDSHASWEAANPMEESRDREIEDDGLSIHLSDIEADGSMDTSDDDDESHAEDSEDMDEDLEEEDYSSDDEPLSDEDHGLFTWDEVEQEVEPQDALVEPMAYPPLYEGPPLPPLNTPVIAEQLLPSLLPGNSIPGTFSLPPIIAPPLREASPSDAAMMRRSVIPQMPTTKPMVDILKEKTGKHAFFEAREENKAAIARQNSCYPSPPSAPPAKQTGNESIKEPSIGVARPEPQKQQNKDPAQAVVESNWLSTGKDFLNTPQEPRNLPRDQELPEDEKAAEAEAMTSAYQFHLWKQSRSVVSGDTEANPRRIGINDIVMGQELGDQPDDSAAVNETPKKRKAADISSATPEEEHWHDGHRVVDSVAAPAAQPISPPASPVASISQPALETLARPTKRMKRIAERVGYAALGGATVGAMIVTSLIYTAPSFA